MNGLKILLLKSDLLEKVERLWNKILRWTRRFTSLRNLDFNGVPVTTFVWIPEPGCRVSKGREGNYYIEPSNQVLTSGKRM